MKNYLAKFNSLNAYKNFITDSDEYVYPSVSVINNDDIRYNNIDYSEVVVTEESNEVLFNILNDNEIPYSNEDGYTVYDLSVITNEMIMTEGTNYDGNDIMVSIFMESFDYEGNRLQSFDEFQYFTSITTVCDYMFDNCTEMTSIILPKSITSIGTMAFHDCHALENITFNSLIKNIATDALLVYTDMEESHDVNINIPVSLLPSYRSIYTHSVDDPNMPAFTGNILWYNENEDAYDISPTIKAANLGYKPIALQLCPAGFFGANQSARWMALKYADYNHPATGSTSSVYMYYGNYNQATGNTNYLRCLLTDGTNDANYGYHDKLSSWEDITVNDNDSLELLKLQSYFGDDSDKLVSIYNNKSFNTTVANYTQGDFNGKSNTTAIISIATAQSDWQTAQTITNNSGVGYTPAACCCYRYTTPGTNKGDWYLGGAAEMILLWYYRDLINDKLSAINAVYSSDCMPALDTNFNYWSSTEYSSQYAYFVYLSIGIVYFNYKNNFNYVIPLFQY